MRKKTEFEKNEPTKNDVIHFKILQMHHHALQINLVFMELQNRNKLK